jgi:RNA polymerase I-specific transcription initiation factor RRN7
MSFPLETYSIAKRISKLIDLKEFSLHGASKSQRRPYPDAKIMALLIIACKIGFNLEINSAWKNWSASFEEKEDKGIPFEDVDENKILEMSDEKLDQYMDWFQSKWIEEDLEGKRMKAPITFSDIRRWKDS